ncbi:MAG: GAF domain-containing sensor histidine kinase [Bacilli bacterium]
MNRSEELIVLKEIAEILNEETEVQRMLESVLQRLLKLTVFETAWVFLVDEHGDYTPVALTNVPSSLLQQPERLMYCGDCWCLERFREHRLEKAYNTMECRRTELARIHNIAEDEDFTHHATVPLQTAKKRFGVLNVAVASRSSFTQDELHMLTTIGYQISSALQRIDDHTHLQQLLVLEERQRFAHTLHDSVKQLLFSAQLHTDSILITNTETKLDTQLQTLRSILQTIGVELQSLIEDHRPDSLAKGWATAVQHYAQLQGLELTFTGEKVPILSPAHEEQLYRITQEALNNVIKHANTNKVYIALNVEHAQYVLQIIDRGNGFCQTSCTQGVGLQSIAQRAATLGGTFTITSDETGTQLTIAWPKEDKA